MIDLDLGADIAALRSTFNDIRSVIGVERLEAEIADLSEKAGAQDLWDDPDAAQKVTSALSHRQSELARITGIERRLDDLEVLVEMAIEGDDEQSAQEARDELVSLTKTLGEFEVQILLDGEYDDRGAVVTIRSGAGGDDATDFAEMLMRMYLRWAERHKYLRGRRGHQVGDLRSGCALRVRHPECRGGHPPPRPHQPVRFR
jgi:peptide chain release factor 2